MPYKRIFSIVFLILCSVYCYAQGNIEKKNRLGDRITEKYYVLPSDQTTKDGQYQAFYRRKKIADGNYTTGVKTGVWNFYNSKGVLLQTFNYDDNSLQFEARESANSNFHYFFDEDVKETDRLTKPIKIGGRFYGYLPYINVFKTPFDVFGQSEYFIAAVELLISPMGRLADYKVHLIAPLLQYDQTFNLSLNFFSEEDKQFIPATLNHKRILSRIMIKCKVNDDGSLDFY
jgi:hypothetical protein